MRATPIPTPLRRAHWTRHLNTVTSLGHGFLRREFRFRHPCLVARGTRSGRSEKSRMEFRARLCINRDRVQGACVVLFEK